ncbi:DUF2235 domain-containing protein [Vibrio cyclitrophicus]
MSSTNTLSKLLLSPLISIVSVCATSSIASQNQPQQIHHGNSILQPPKEVVIKGMHQCYLTLEELQTLADISSGKLIPNSSMSKTAGNIPLTIQEINDWLRVKNFVEDASTPAVSHYSESRKVYFVVFDGTWNDRETGNQTVPANLSKDLELFATDNPFVSVKYYSGVGTRTSTANKYIDGFFGRGTKENAELAFHELNQFITSEKGAAPHVYAIGFSRGAASARHFLNLVNDQYKNQNTESTKLLFAYPRLYALLFDTVATGQHNNLRLETPEELTSILHFVATSEERSAFPIVRINKPLNPLHETMHRFVEIDLPGVHSDIGGGYEDSLEKLSYYLSVAWLHSQGIDIKAEKKNFVELLNFGRNDSRYVRLMPPNGENKRKEITPKTNTKKKSQPHSNRSYIKNELGTSITLSALGAYSAQLQLKKVRSEPKKPKQFLALNLALHNNILTVTTNCPNYIYYNDKENSVALIDANLAILNQKLLSELNNSYGLITSYPVYDKKDFIYRSRGE